MIIIDQSIDSQTIQHSIWETARQLQLPVALWRLPQSDTIHLIVDLSGEPSETHLDLETLPPGFALSPFVNTSGENSFYLTAHLYYTFTGDQWQATELPPAATFPDRLSQFKEELSRCLRAEKPCLKAVSRAAEVEAGNTSEAEKKRFEALVQKAIQTIEEGSFQKVVLSRTRSIELPGKTDLLGVFHRMSLAYASAFVSLVSVPGLGTWMGASPEILVSVDKNQIFRTMALAGTQALQPDKLPGQATWTQKEIEEQALVGRYIINCFKKIRLREYEEDGPKTVVAGRLLHLRTDFRVDTQAVNFPQLGTVMLKLLHPTSAVCGMPKEESLQFIQEYEGYNREMYSGFLGPVNIDQESHLFVNLRCTQWQDQAAILYAGAGVTAHSIPEKEWRETELKCQTMLRVIAGEG